MSVYNDCNYIKGHVPTNNDMSPQLFFLFILILSLFILPSPPYLLSALSFIPMISVATYTMMLSYRCKYPNSCRTNRSGCANVTWKMTLF